MFWTYITLWLFSGHKSQYQHQFWNYFFYPCIWLVCLMDEEEDYWETVEEWAQRISPKDTSPHIVDF